MLYAVTLFFPIISDFEGTTKQVTFSHEVDADSEQDAVLKVLELEIIDCGEGMFARPEAASIYFVHPGPAGTSGNSGGEQ